MELTGFKSFPSKTAINFEKGITAIIGPNGSGKSNISDAIRWVFGEMSSKILRGAKMEDVIFGGTKEIKPSAFARVSLIIDNSDKLVDCDYSEIKITRQLARSGESGYFINERGVRLKDIHELFLNTGIGKEGYSIIGQGQIAELISKKSEDRRSIFEEASGISKYRYKKSEAEKKLIEVRDNLTRIKDIVHEIEGRIGPLENEAEKARIYLDLYERKKSLEIYVWVNSIEKIKNEFEKIIGDYEISKFNYESADSQFNRLNEKTDNLYDKIQEINLAYENKKNENFTIQSSIVEKKANIENIKKETSKIEDDINFNLHEIKKNKYEIKNTEDLITVKTENLDKINSEYKSMEMEIEDKISYLEHIEQKLSGQNNKIDEITAAISDKNAEINVLKIKISEKSAEIKHILERKNILSGSIEKTAALKEKNKKDLSILNSRKKSDETEKDKINEKIQNIENQIQQLQKSEKDKRREYDNLYLEYEKNEGYIKSLTKIHENLEGYPESVKSVVKSGLSGINGTVAQLIETEEKYAAAIEVALGQNLQNIIVENENAAKEAIRYLKANNLGRATFYPVSIIKGRFIERERLDYLQRNDNASGFAGMGSSLVGYDLKYENIIKYLLGRTIICDNINNAAKIAEKFNYMYKIVTLDGQVINAGGSFTGGSAVKKGSMISGKNEIENLKNKNIEYKKQQIILQEEAEKTLENINKLSAGLNILKEQLNLQISNLYATDSEIKLKLSEIDQNENQIYSAENELKTGGEKEVSGMRAKLEKSLFECNIKFEEYSRLLEKSKIEMKKTAGEKDASIIDINQKKLLLSGILNNINIENERFENLNRTRMNLRGQNDKLSLQNEEKTKELSRMENETKTILKNITELENKFAQIENLLTGYENRRNELEKTNAETKSDIKEKSNERDILFRETTRLESMKNEKEKEHDSLINKLWEEYSLAFSEAKEIVIKSVELTVIKENTDKTNVITRELSKIKSAIKEIGNVNVNAIEEYRELSERYNFMTDQAEDLFDSLESLQKIINNFEIAMKTAFSESMKQINENFKNVFAELFGGGTAEVIYADPENVLESELEIEVQPPGKNVKHISLLSGGEQAFVAIALYFALLKINPAPFCVLDEIESALDEVNVGRFAVYLKRYAEQTQFIMISHRRGTMEAADRLYGLTMQDKGISKYLALDINEAERRINKIL